MDVKDMAVSELILARRTVHSYLREPVPFEILEKAIECAIHAPIHRLTYPWRFFHTGPEARAKIASWQDEFKRKKYLGGGELFILGLAVSGKPEVDEENYASLGCALQNMALYLWNEGYGTKWSTGAVSTDPRLYDLLPPSVGASSDVGAGGVVTADKLRLCGFFWVGRAETVPDRPERPSVDKFLFKLP